MKHHLRLGLKPRFRKDIAVQYPCDKPVEDVIADNRLSLIIGGRGTNKPLNHLPQWLTTAAITDSRAQALKYPLINGFQALLKLLGCPPERAQFAWLRRVAKQSIDLVDNIEFDGVESLGAPLKVIRLSQRSQIKRIKLELD